MSYRIKEIYFTQQGEGKNTGMDAVFIRFSGCNLWSGKEKHRAKAICNFCDTDFNGIDGTNGGEYSKESLLAKVQSLWISSQEQINVVMTGVGSLFCNLIKLWLTILKIMVFILLLKPMAP